MPKRNTFDGHHAHIRGNHNGEGRSPICASVRTLAPFMDPNITGLVIKLRVVPGKVIYTFDWARGSTVHRVDLNGWDRTNQLRLASLASGWAELKLTTAPNRAFTSTLRDAVGLPTAPVIPAQAQLRGMVRLCRQDHLDPGTLPPQAGPAPLAANTDEVFSGHKS